MAGRISAKITPLSQFGEDAVAMRQMPQLVAATVLGDWAPSLLWNKHGMDLPLSAPDWDLAACLAKSSSYACYLSCKGVWDSKNFTLSAFVGCKLCQDRQNHGRGPRQVCHHTGGCLGICIVTSTPRRCSCRQSMDHICVCYISRCLKPSSG